MTSGPKEWLQHLQEALVKSSQAPVEQEGFPFPWEQASEALLRDLGIKDLRLAPRPSQWKMGDEILSGMGNEPSIVSIEPAPIGGFILWMMSEEDIAALTAAALSSEEKIEGFSDPRLQEGFYQFLLLKAIGALDHIKAFKDISLRLLPRGEAPREGGLVLDIAIALPMKTVYGRLVCPQSFLTALKNYRPVRTQSLFEIEEIKKLQVSLRTEIGSVSLPLDEWRLAMPGDFIALDTVSYDPHQEKGSLTLALGATPLLLARFKPEGLKIVDYAFYSKEAPLLEDSGAAQGPEPSPASEESQEHLWAAEESTEDLSKKAPQILLTVELDKIAISVEKLAGLKPEDLLEMNFFPEQGVDLLIEGKTVARGDLLKLGSTLGVKLLAIHG